MTRKRAECEIAEAVTRFKKEYLGRGPLETRVYILDDMVIVRMKDAFTLAERKLAQQIDCKKCWDTIKEVRSLLMEQGREQLEEIVLEAVGLKVVSMHNDVSTKTGESLLLFVLEQKPVFDDPGCWRDDDDFCKK
jgi:uncharacterized protein YbcI